MSEWASLIAVFWVLYLADGLVFGKRRHHFAHGGFRPGHASVALTAVQWLCPWPWTWRLRTDDPACSLSPEGLCNLPAGCAGRPADEPLKPRVLRWEELVSISGDHNRISVNGADFCAATSLLGAADLGRLREKLLPLAPAQREQLLRAEFARWFRPASARRRLHLWLARTRAVAASNALVLVTLVLLSAYAAADPTYWLPEELVPRVNRLIPPLLAVLGLVHLGTLLRAFFLRRHQPGRGARPGAAQWLGALLVPPQALRLRHLLAQDWREHQHPVSLALALRDVKTARSYARNTLGDHRWPLTPRAPVEALALRIRAWQAAELATLVERSLANHGLSASAGFDVPNPHSPLACAWCPRCGDQFERPGAACPRGVPAELFPKEAKADRGALKKH